MEILVTTLDAEDRVAIGQLADLLIPAASGMPSATEVDVPGQWIDRALTARPELGELLRPAIDAVKATDAGSALAALKQNDAETLETFFGAVTACYYMHPGVRKRLGYAGQNPVPIAEGEAEYYLEGDLLGPVTARGPIYRLVD